MQILFEGRQATGVLFKYQGEEKVVTAKSEIILASGTVGTTKLLLLSGVGPKAHLEELKVRRVLVNYKVPKMNDSLCNLIIH